MSASDFSDDGFSADDLDLDRPAGAGDWPERGNGPALAVVRGASRLLADLGFAVIPEFVIGCGRRADIAGIDGRGRIVLVEVKVSLADFRGDAKWPDYLDYCDTFFFAVPPEFPREAVEGPLAWPERTGLIVADRFGAAILRPAPHVPMNGSRRKAETLRFALTAAGRLHRIADPERGL
jgi:hypothetical protein